MRQIKQNAIRNSVKNLCFYAGLLIEIAIVIIDKSTFLNSYEGKLFRLSFLLFGIAMLMEHYTKRERITIVLFGLLGVVSYGLTGRNEIIRIVVFVAACKEMDMDKVMKVLFWATLAGCIAIVCASVLGLFGELSLTQKYEGAGIDTRYTFGMGHPNTFHSMVWALMMLGMYIYRYQLKWYIYFILFLGNIGVFFLTKTLTCLLVAIMTIALAVFFQYFMKYIKGKWILICSMLVSIGCIIVSVLGAANASKVLDFYWGRNKTFSARIFVKLDKLLTGRLLSLACTENAEGTVNTWRLFSNPQSTYYFDLGWVRLFYWYGIIPAIIFLLLLLYLLYFVFKKKDYMAVVMVMTITVYTVVEAHFVSVYIARNYLLFLLGMYWWQMLPREGENIK